MTAAAPASDRNASLADAASWLAGCETLPADIDAKARELLLDTLGCLLAGLNHPDVKSFGRALQVSFPGDVAWPASDIKLAPSGSAALGATAACWDEACEGNASAHGRPGLPVVPALLALAATRDDTLGDLLLALVTGYEIGTRAGEAWRIPPGWHVDGSWHALGVAAAVARLMSGPEHIQAAIEAAACQIPASLYLPITVGSVLRNTYPAHAVLLGIMAAAASEAGFPMPAGALEEGRRRVLRAEHDAVTTAAGHWTIRDGYLKPFAAVRHAHYGVEAALRLRKRPIFSLPKIGAVRLQVYDEAMRYCGNRAPRTAIQAQFSLSYAVAAALALGDLGPEAYTTLDDPTITDIERRIVVEVDPSRVQRGATLIINIDGASLSETVDAVAGDPSTPMTRNAVIDKFHRYTDPIVGRPHAEALVAFCLEGSPAAPARQCFAAYRSK